MHDQTAHNLSMITGYIVEQTIKDGERLAEPLTKNKLDGANKYGEALELARGLCRYTRKPEFSCKSWAVIRAIYTDGCISEPF